MGPLLNLGQVEATQLMDFLYRVFHRDFVMNKTRLNKKIWIDLQSHRKEDGKEAAFWHLTSRTQKCQVKQGARSVLMTERLPDYRRSERLEWVRLIIEGHADPRVRCFYHQESNNKRDIRLYLWAHQHDFVVILQKLGKSASFLVTSFYMDQARKRFDYQQRYEAYVSGTVSVLKGCGWF